MHEHEHEHAESSHSDKNCAACVFINTHVDFDIHPTTIGSPFLVCDTLPPTDVVFITLKPTSTIRSRAPPIFYN